MNKQALPELGKRYHFFEDGKSGPSRHYIIEIIEIIPFEEMIDGELLDNTLDMEDEFIFIRTNYGGWFSIGHWFEDGQLDVDNSKYNEIVEYWEQDDRDYDEASQTKGLI